MSCQNIMVTLNVELCKYIFGIVKADTLTPMHLSIFALIDDMETNWENCCYEQLGFF